MTRFPVDYDLDLSLHRLQALYRSGNSTPAEVMELVSGRIRQSQRFNVWTVMPDQQIWLPYLRRLAQYDPADLPLYGIPFAIKDNIDLAGVTTTAACPAFAYVPEESAYVVQLLLAAGALPVGKTNMDQFATGLVGTRSPYGVTRNSVNPDYISGGSSAGSAVAVALGMATFALGTDTAGSGRVPACFNQLLGYKPSKGFVSNRGVVPACRSQDCVSVLARGTEDLQAIMQCLLVADNKKPSPYQVNLEREQAVAQLTGSFGPGEKFRVGIPCERDLQFFAHGDYEERFSRAIAAMESAGGQCVEIDIQPFLSAAKLLYEGPWVAERYMVVADILKNAPDALLPEIRKIIQPGQVISAAETFNALYRLEELKAAADQQLSQVDCIMMPTTGGIFTVDEVINNPIQLNSKLGLYTNFMNLLDYAAMALPADNPQSRLPFGITLFGLRGADSTLLQFARRYLTANAIVMPAKIATVTSPHTQVSLK